MSQSINKWVRFRVILVGLGLMCLGFWLTGRFFYLQIIMGPQLREEASRETQKECPVLPVRGQIRDRRGNELAISTQVSSLVAHPKQISYAAHLTNPLAPILGFKKKELTEILTRPRSFVWVKRHLTPEKEEAFRAWEAEMEKKTKGHKPSQGRQDKDAIYLIPEAKRYYPQQTLAGSVLGFCNLDGQGLEGLEHQFDNYLYGKPKTCMKMLDARGHIVVSEEKAWDEEVMGNNLVLTLDGTLQYIAEKELRQAVSKWRARGGTVLVVRPQTGEILAMAQCPGMDPNRYGQYSEEVRRNRIVTDALEPGSTFKIFIAASALDAQAVRAGDRFNCEMGVWHLGSKEVIHDVHKYGTLTVQQIIQKSSNIGAAKISARLGPARLDKYLHAFGFGSRSGILFPGENAGIVKNLVKARSPLDRATVAFGQGVSVTPLQLTMALAAMGNEGVLMEPLLVKAVVSPRGRVIKEFLPREARRVLSVQASRQMLGIMETVTQKGGTALEAVPPGFTVAGKTGTAQKLVGRGYSHSKFNSLFIGMVPADKPVLAICVIIDEPQGAIYGGVVAAPAFREIAAQSLRVLGYYPQEGPTTVLAGMLPTPALAGSSAKAQPAPAGKPLAVGKTQPAPSAKLPAPPRLPKKPLTVMPDLSGLTIRQALDLLHRSGLKCQFEGSGLAVGQEPSPGTPIGPGGVCKVQFKSQS